MDTFNSLSNRLEKHESNLESLVDKVKNLEKTQNEQIKRIKRLEDSRNQSERQNIEIQEVKSFYLQFYCS